MIKKIIDLQRSILMKPKFLLRNMLNSFKWLLKSINNIDLDFSKNNKQIDNRISKLRFCVRNDNKNIGVLFGIVKEKINKKRNEICILKKVRILDIPILKENGSFRINKVNKCFIVKISKGNGIFIKNDKENINIKLIPDIGVWIEMYLTNKKRFFFKINNKKFGILQLLLVFNVNLNELINEIIYDLIEKNIYLKNKSISLIKSKKKILNLIIKGIVNIGKSNIESINKIYENDETGKKFYDLFFNRKCYWINESTRNRINRKLGKNIKSNFVTKDDLIGMIELGIKLLLKEKVNFDDMDLENKKILDIDYVIKDIVNKNYFFIEREIKLEKMINNQYLFVYRILYRKIMEVFNISQYVQYLDQTNSLAEISHKRRILLGNTNEIIADRERNIHESFYGKICPIETPEGKKIGIVNSFTILTKLNHLKEISIPVIKVNKEDIENKIMYINQEKEKDVFITSLYEFNKGNKRKELILARKGNKVYYVNRYEIDFIDFSNVGLFSIVPLMIPFINYNDGNRILMGTNMQKQALICINKELSYIGTGMEKLPINSLNSRFLINNFKGVYDGSLIIEKKDIGRIKLIKKIKLRKYEEVNNHHITNNQIRTNKNRDLFIDREDTIKGNIALGRNLIVAMLSWKGFSYEDSIVISDSLIKEKKLTTLHLRKIKISFLENINERVESVYLKYIEGIKGKRKRIDGFYKNGCIRLGTYITEKTILLWKKVEVNKKIGKLNISWINKTFERIKREDYDIKVYRVPKGIKGRIIGINRKGFIDGKDGNCNKGKREIELIKKVIKERIRRLDCLTKDFVNKQKTIKNRRNVIIELKKKYYQKIILRNELINSNDIKINNNLNINKKKEIILNILMEKDIKVGDKIAGRYGNKGVISRIVNKDKMPYLKDGTICEVLLNPISIPSRMNIGQLFELKLGLGILGLLRKNKKEKNEIKDKLGLNLNKDSVMININAFDINEINNVNNFNTIIFNKNQGRFLGINKERDKCELYDGINGKILDRKVAIGYMYLYKLNHLAWEKIHGRAIGPYSISTNQPLRGKRRNGGQRFGEMETWVLEAYGAAYTLREMITIKSDDINTRDNVIKNLLRNRNIWNIGIPETFKMLIMELRGLMIDISIGNG